MKKTRITRFFAIAVLALATLSGCSFPLMEKPREASAPDIPRGFGALRVSLTRGGARTVIPEADMENLYLEYSFARDGAAAEEKTPVNGVFILKPGNYSLTVRAFTDSGGPVRTLADSGSEGLVAQGSTEEDFKIAADTDAGTVSVALRPVTDQGTGSLEFGLRYPSGVTVESFTLTRIAGEESFDLLNPPPTRSGSNPIVLSGSKDAIPSGYYLLRLLLKNSAGLYAGKSEVVHIYQNLTARTSLADYTFSRDDFTAYLVTTTADSGPGSLRQALSSTPPGQTVQVALEPGSIIELKRPLKLTRGITIEGNGVTLIRAVSWAKSDTSQLLYIEFDDKDAEAVIRRVHFKNGLATCYGGAIQSKGVLTLESCIFSGNRTEDRGGALYSENTLTIKGCTFCGNTVSSAAVNDAGAVRFNAPGKTLTLTGNLFYGNTALYYPVVYVSNNNSSVDASYNVVDAVLGKGNKGQSGWVAGPGDSRITDVPVSPKTFRLYGNSAAGRLPAVLPEEYPAVDFYGNPVSGGGAAGAVQAAVAGTGYYLDLAVNNSLAGTITANPAPNEDGIVPAGPVVITATPGGVYGLESLQINGTSHPVSGNTLSINLSAHTWARAVFSRQITVDNFTDGAGSVATAGTLRHALTNAADGDLITFSGVTPGTTSIELTSVLPVIARSVAIEGAGVILTRAASWPGSDTSQLLRIENDTVEVTIRRVHFKDGLATNFGAAILNFGILTLESCIFSGNRTTGSYGGGGVIQSKNTLTIRGCTFYDNACDGGVNGGVVDFLPLDKTLTLTGNLFYLNRSAKYPVISAYDADVIASYNVVDVAFGSKNISRCGWEQGPGDRTTMDLGINGLPFTDTAGFEPVPALGNVLPSARPEDFPAVDFYGAARTFPGAPGAVK